MTDKITLDFDKNQLINSLMSMVNSKERTHNREDSTDKLLEKYVESRLKNEEYIRENKKLNGKNKLLVKTISELNKNYNKLLDKHEKCRSQLEIQKIQTKLYLSFSKVLFDFMEKFVQNHVIDPKITCSICLNTLNHQNMEYICMTRCQHYFHETCLDKYMINDNEKCPNCRNEIYDIKIGHFELKNSNIEFIKENIKFRGVMKNFLENCPMIDIKTIDDHEDALRVADYNNFVLHPDEYSVEPDILVNNGELILGSIISRFEDEDDYEDDDVVENGEENGGENEGEEEDIEENDVKENVNTVMETDIDNINNINIKDRINNDVSTYSDED